MDYAILKTGSKQYRVKPGDIIEVEKLPAEEGSSIELTDVLAISRDGDVTLGTPQVPDASIHAHVREQGKDDKIIVFKYKRKVRYRRKKGHRQHYTKLAITSIWLGGEEIATLEGHEPQAVVLEETPMDEVEDEFAGELEEDEVDDGPSDELVGDVEDDEADDESEDEAVAEANDGPAGEVRGGGDR